MLLVCVESDKIPLLCKLYEHLPVEFSVITTCIAIYMLNTKMAAQII